MLFEKNKDKQKDAGVGLLKIKNKVRTVYLTTQVLDTTNLPWLLDTKGYLDRLCLLHRQREAHLFYVSN